MAPKPVHFEPARDGLNSEGRPIQVPADKSISHRAAIIAAICDSRIRIDNYLEASDTKSTLNALTDCGIQVDRLAGGSYEIGGKGLRGLSPPQHIIDIGNSGTSIRLLPGVLAGQQGCFTLDGDESLKRRPMARVVEPLSQMGIDIRSEDGHSPVTVCGSKVHGIDYVLPMASAQVKSAILLAALYADSPTTVKEPAISRNHTEILLKKAGVEISAHEMVIVIQPASNLQLTSLIIPNDFSSAAFFIVAATIIPDSSIAIANVGTNPTRTGLRDILDSMGANIKLKPAPHYMKEESSNDIHVQSSELRAVEVGAEISGRSIDELPLVGLAAAFAPGQTKVRGAAELRFKESDRIKALVDNLSSVGVQAEALDDGFIVEGGTGIDGGDWASFGDHRMAMMGAIAGLASRSGVTVDDFECVSISYPDFLRDVEMLGGIGRTA